MQVEYFLLIFLDYVFEVPLFDYIALLEPELTLNDARARSLVSGDQYLINTNILLGRINQKLPLIDWNTYGITSILSMGFYRT